MNSEVMHMGIFLFFQTAVGVLGNWSLLLNYFLSVFTEKSLMPKDTIIEHLAFASSLAIISRGIRQTMMEFGMKNFLDNIACKLVLYLCRVARGTSLYTTCLLSCFQAITMSPKAPGG
jgi:vomeronasal1 receptor